MPLALIGRQPSFPSRLTAIPTAGYYAAQLWLAPVVVTVQMLVVAHVGFCARGRRSDADLLINLTGMTGLAAGALLVVWGWISIALKLGDCQVLGIAHLLFDLWPMCISAWPSGAGWTCRSA